MFGVAVLAAIFSANGDYGTPAAYVAGLQPAIAVGAVVVGHRGDRGAVHPGACRARGRVVDVSATDGDRDRWQRSASPPDGIIPAGRPRQGAGLRSRTLPAMPSVVSHVTADDGTDLLVRHWPAATPEAGGAWAGTPWASVLLVHGLGEHSGRYETSAIRWRRPASTSTPTTTAATADRAAGAATSSAGRSYHDDLQSRLDEIRLDRSGGRWSLYGHSTGWLDRRRLSPGRSTQAGSGRTDVAGSRLDPPGLEEDRSPRPCRASPRPSPSRTDRRRHAVARPAWSRPDGR